MAEKRKGRGCGRGCLITGLILLGLVLLVTALLWFQPFSRLWGKGAYVEAPNRLIGEQLYQEMTDAGLSPEGVSVYVLPREDGSGSAAFFVVDAEQGFDPDEMEDDDFLQFLRGLADSQAVDDAQVDRLGP